MGQHIVNTERDYGKYSYNLNEKDEIYITPKRKQEAIVLKILSKIFTFENQTIDSFQLVTNPRKDMIV